MAYWKAQVKFLDVDNFYAARWFSVECEDLYLAQRHFVWAYRHKGGEVAEILVGPTGISEQEYAEMSAELIHES